MTNTTASKVAAELATADLTETFAHAIVLPYRLVDTHSGQRTYAGCEIEFTYHGEPIALSTFTSIVTAYAADGSLVKADLDDDTRLRIDRHVEATGGAL